MVIMDPMSMLESAEKGLLLTNLAINIKFSQLPSTAIVAWLKFKFPMRRLLNQNKNNQDYL